MTPTDTQFTGSVPQVYDALLVPLIFEQYAGDLAERVAAAKPRDVLETAAGTGVLTRAIAARLSSSARIVATDLNQPMLDLATIRQPPGKSIEWRQADAMALPFDDLQFDVVACQFGAMFFPDKVQAYRETHRVLKLGGHFIFDVWDRIAENEFAAVVSDALKTFFPSDPPDFMARTPHGYHDAEAIREHLRLAGFSSISVETVGRVSKGRSPRDVAIAFCQGTPMKNEIAARDPSQLEAATQHAADALARRFGDGAIEGRIGAHILTAVR